MMKTLQLLTASLAVTTAFFTPTTRMAVKPTGTCAAAVAVRACLQLPPGRRRRARA